MAMAAGHWIGAVVFAPPALQIGLLVSQTAMPWVALLEHLMPQIVRHFSPWLVFGLITSAVGALVIALGAFAGTLLAPVLYPVISRPGLRPGWRALRVVVLLALFAGAVVYADQRVQLPWPEAAVPARSAWLEREKEIFREALGGQRYELVVWPVQAEEPSFDRIARSLMTRYLSLRAEERTGQRAPDPTLLARAVGKRERTLNRDDAFALATALGARRLVLTTVRRADAIYAVQAALWTRADAGWSEAATARLDSLAYDDRLPPSVSFRDAVDVLLDGLRIESKRSAEVTAAPMAAEVALHDLRRVAMSTSGSPADRALRLQVMASLHERGSFDAEALWERSLVALWRAPAGSEVERLLEARAYMHLYRRPYALQRLGTPSSASGKALAAALDGNVPELERAAAAIEDRAQRLIAEIELADLYAHYDLDKRLLERRKELLSSPWTQPAVLGYRLSAPEWFRGDVHPALAAELQGVTHVGWHAWDLARAWLRWAYFLDFSVDEHNLWSAQAVERAYRPLWQAKRADWLSRNAADRLAEWDYYELLFATNRQALFKTIHSTLNRQASPAHALGMIERLGAAYSDHPHIAHFEARALERLGRESAPGRQKRLFSRSSALAAAAYAWEGGETRLAASAEHLIYERPYQKWLDEPARWYRGKVATQRMQFERLRYRPNEIEAEIAAARRRLAYSDYDVGPLHDLVGWLRRAGRVDEALTLVEDNRHRFVGSTTRVEILAQAAQSGRGGDFQGAYRELLDLDPESWDARSRLAKAQMEAGQPLDAQKTYLAFPKFRRAEGDNAVEVTNRAYEAAHYFYRLGERELARPLFALALETPTGSGAEMRSRETLAVLNDDLRAALRQAQVEVYRYGNSYGAMRELMYMTFADNGSAFDARFFEHANRFGDEVIWTAAFIAHRLQGLEGAALEAWLADAAARDTRRDYLTGALRERHAFMLAYMDRTPSAEALAHVRRVTQANNRSPFYPQVAEGYTAWRKRDFALAAQKLRGPHDDLYNVSVNRRHSLSEWLPYVVLSYARSGRADEAQNLLARHQANIGADYDYLIARALIEGGEGRHEAAAASLQLAFHRLTFTRARTFLVGYTLLENCELLYAETGNDLYRSLLEDLGARLQAEFPYSWAAAVEAKYSRDPQRRRVAMAAAFTLDPGSERLAGFSHAELTAALPAAAASRNLLGASLRAREKRAGKL